MFIIHGRQLFRLFNVVDELDQLVRGDLGFDDVAVGLLFNVGSDIVTLLKHFLPQAAVNRDDVLAQMRLRHRHRQASIDAAYKVQARHLE